MGSDELAKVEEAGGKWAVAKAAVELTAVVENVDTGGKAEAPTARARPAGKEGGPAEIADRGVAGASTAGAPPTWTGGRKETGSE